MKGKWLFVALCVRVFTHGWLNKRRALVCAGLAVCGLLVAAAAQAPRVSFIARQDFDVGSLPVSVAVGDFDGDGVQDLAVVNQNSNNVSVLLGNGDGSFQAAQNFAAGNNPASVAVGDFDGDGVQDLAVVNQNSNNVSVLLGNGDGSFQAAQNFGAGPNPHSVAVGDFNGDGLPDLAVANISSNDVSVLINNTPPPSGKKGALVHSRLARMPAAGARSPRTAER